MLDATADTAGWEASLESGRDVVLDGGNVPEVVLRRDDVKAGGALASPLWSARVSAGVSDTRAQAFFRDWGARWIPGTEKDFDISLRVGGDLRGAANFRQEDGLLRATMGGAVPLGSARLQGEASRTRGRGSVQLLRRGEPPLPLDWAVSGWDARGGLRLDIAGFGSATARLVREESHPSPVEGRYRLETRTTGSGWELGWHPQGNGPWIEVESRDGDWKSEGWSDTLGSDTRFHDFRVASRMLRGSTGWRSAHWSIGVGGEERSLDAPKASIFSPFLAWNALDLSAWAPVDQILSDQREHLSGTLEYRALGADASWRRPGRRFDFGIQGGISWRSLESHLLHRATRMSFLGAGWKLETDSVGAPRLRALLAPLALEGAFHLGVFGDLGVQGRMAIPLWFERLRRDGAAPAAPTNSGDDGDDITGLWRIGTSWRGSW